MYIQANRVVNQFEFLLMRNKNQTIKDEEKFTTFSDFAIL